VRLATTNRKNQPVWNPGDALHRKASGILSSKLLVARWLCRFALSALQQAGTRLHVTLLRGCNPGRLAAPVLGSFSQ